ncbi:2484_t:CDS:2 [Acaulospora morrowiae]|uniref:2484_t:CDS:1 n=1 Tax=Acaulospora morrowiae TaxID=94023 RepID=A0A9N9A8Y2_9GLOM|nr:2484_t:CDS:2 [Acaulospora morrowiae]
MLENREKDVNKVLSVLDSPSTTPTTSPPRDAFIMSQPLSSSSFDSYSYKTDSATVDVPTTPPPNRNAKRPRPSLRKKLDELYQNGQTPEALKQSPDKMKMSDTIESWP